MNGPILFVDKHTREIVTNENDSINSLIKINGIYSGKYSETLPIANTAVRWNGKHWTMVIWQSLSSEKHKRNQLIMHEIWHRIQNDIGFHACQSKNTHLDELNGRLLIKMEWLALNGYIQSGFKKITDLHNALNFRNQRHSLYPKSQERESTFEMHEGLAEYSGITLAGYSNRQRTALLNKKVINSLDNENLLMSFAYTSGALYGTILDKIDKNWRDNLTKNDDFGKIISELMNWSPNSQKLNVEKLYAQYDNHNLVKKENNYEIERLKFLDECKKRFRQSPKLIIPMKMARISFNPFGVVPFGDDGTIYKTINCFGEWGKLTTVKGGLITTDWSKVIVDAHRKIREEYRSDFWIISLNKGWEIVKKENGDYTIKQSN